MEESETVPIFRSEKKSGRGGKTGTGLKFMLAYLPLIFLLVLTFYVSQSKTVFVVEGEKGEEKKQYITFCRTVGDFLQKNDLQVDLDDQLEPAPAEKIVDGQVIRIQKAFSARVGKISSRSGLEERYDPPESRVAGNVSGTGTALNFVIDPDLDLALDPGPAPGLAPDLVLDPAPAPGLALDPAATPASVPDLAPGLAADPVLDPATALALNPVLAGSLTLAQARASSKDLAPPGDPGPAGEAVSAKSLFSAGGPTISNKDLLLAAGEPARVVNLPSGEVQAVDKDLISSEKKVFSHGNQIFAYISCMEMSATAYCPGTPESGCPIDERGASQCTGFYNDGYTGTGVPAVPGDGSLELPHLIAVDPAVIPLKSLIYIEDIGFARAEDTGAAIKGQSIDILFSKHNDARNFGRQKLKIYFLDPY